MNKDLDVEIEEMEFFDNLMKNDEVDLLLVRDVSDPFADELLVGTKDTDLILKKELSNPLLKWNFTIFKVFKTNY